MTKKNVVALADSYKYSHPWQYPPGTTQVSSYIEARGYDPEVFRNGAPEVVMFGLQLYIEDYLKTIVTKLDVDEVEDTAKMHGIPFHSEGWRYIVEAHEGRLPLEICAVPEGMVTALHTPLVQVRNRDHRVPWLVSHIETSLLRSVWYGTTVATLSREIKKVIKKYLEKNGDPNLLDFKLHDFGARGASSHETAELGGLAHLINFKGTDTFEAVYRGYKTYGEILGYSIPASEHSTITPWGDDQEIAAFANMLEKWPTGLVACVSDSYDIYRAASTLWGEVLREKVMARNGTLVVRPDSGDPVEVTHDVVQILGEKFGYTTNAKGYKVLDPHVRIIQGDGVDMESITKILSRYDSFGWSADNIAFGMGGALLQKVNRDTLKFAMKANEVVVDGVVRPVSKHPITDSVKTSKAFRQATVRIHDRSIQVMTERDFLRLEEEEMSKVDSLAAASRVPQNMLVARFSNGYVFNRQTFDDIRAYAHLF